MDDQIIRSNTIDTGIPPFPTSPPTKPIKVSIIIKLQASSIRRDVSRDKGTVAQQISKTGQSLVSVFIGAADVPAKSKER